MKVEVEVKDAISDNYDDANLSSSFSFSQQVAISFFRAASYFVAAFFLFFCADVFCFPIPSLCLPNMKVEFRKIMTISRKREMIM